MKTGILIAAAALATCATAGRAEADGARAGGDDAERYINETLGGALVKPGRGRVAVVNCQGRVADEDVAKAARRFNGHVRVAMDVLRGEYRRDGGIGQFALPPGAAAAVFVVDDDALPMSLIAPEVPWGVVNVAKFAGVKSAALAADRFGKEFARVACLAYGGGASAYDGTVMRRVSRAEDLDEMADTSIAAYQVMGLVKNLAALGVTPFRLSNYREACREGWAPEPTNEVQRAIWNKVHQMPANPMKIEFDPKKGR